MARRTGKRLVPREIQSAIAYIRVSSDEQAREDRWSVDAQLREVRRYCEARGWELVKVYTKDVGHSAKGSDITTRPDFALMLDEVTSGAVHCDVVVTHTLDRYARNMVVAMTTLADLSAHGITYSSVTEGEFDFSDPDKRIHLQMLAMFAEYFSEKLSQHTSKGKRERAAQGLPNGDLPYGYRNPLADTALSAAGVYNTATAVAIPEEAAVVALAYELYASGHQSDAGVAAALNEAGHRMRGKRHPAGGPFTKDTVTALLQNRFYLGEIRHPDGRYLPGRHQAIVDADLFARAQAQRTAKRALGNHGAARSPLGRGVGGRGVYVGAGLVYCAACRQPLRAQAGGATNKAYYRCAAPERGIPCAAVRRGIPMAAVEEALGATIGRDMRLPERWRAQVLAGVAAGDEAARLAARAARLRADLARAQKHLLDGYVTEAQFVTKRDAIQEELATLERRAGAGVDLARGAALLERLPDLWARDDTTRRADLARDVFAAIWVDLDARRVAGVQLIEDLQPLRTALQRDEAAIRVDSGLIKPTDGASSVVARNRRDSNPRSPA